MSDSMQSTVLEIDPGGTISAPQPLVYVSDIQCGSAGENTAVLNGAIGALGPRGGTLRLPACDIFCGPSAGLQMAGLRDVIFQGEGGMTGGAAAATRLIFRGLPTNWLDCRSSAGICFRDMQILYTTSMAGATLLDYEHSVNSDSGYPALERVFIGGLGISDANTLVNLDQALGMTFYKANVQWADAGIRGITNSGTYSNGHSFYDCTFANIQRFPVIDPGESWQFFNPTVEPLQSGNAGFISQTVGMTAKALAITGGWFGDANAKGAWVLFSGDGFVTQGVEIGDGATWAILGQQGPVTGLVFAGNNVDSVGNLFQVVAGAHSGWTVHPNHYVNTGPISFAAGSFPDRSIIDNPKDRLYMPGMMTSQGGPVSDASFPDVPPDGTMAYDTVNHDLYVRSGGVWRSTHFV